MSSKRPPYTASELIPGQTYRVVKAFTDYDDLAHPPGETWTFVAHSFLPYDDGLTIFTTHDGRNGTFRLQWRKETQGAVIDGFSELVEEV